MLKKYLIPFSFFSHFIFISSFFSKEGSKLVFFKGKRIGKKNVKDLLRITFKSLNRAENVFENS